MNNPAGKYPTAGVSKETFSASARAVRDLRSESRMDRPSSSLLPLPPPPAPASCRRTSGPRFLAAERRERKRGGIAARCLPGVFPDTRGCQSGRRSRRGEGWQGGGGSNVRSERERDAAPRRDDGGGWGGVEGGEGQGGGVESRRLPHLRSGRAVRCVVHARRGCRRQARRAHMHTHARTCTRTRAHTLPEGGGRRLIPS